MSVAILFEHRLLRFRLGRVLAMTQRYLFYLLLLFLPTQLGLHFWPPYSHIGGIRVDYLSPTVYFTDVLIGILFVVWLIQSVIARSPQSRRTTKQSHKIAALSSLARNDIKNIKFFTFLISILIGIVFSKSLQVGVYGCIKLLEYIFFGFYVAQQKRANINNIVICFAVGVLFESSLAIAQFYFQHSLQGIFYLFGERLFNPQTPGIANASLNGELMLRPYGTFPHPNVLAGYLLIAMQLVSSRFTVGSSQLKKGIYLLSLLFGSIALFLTMSRVAIALWVLNILFYIFQNFRSKHNTYYILLNTLLVLLIGSIFLSPLSNRFAHLSFFDEAVVQRFELVNASIKMIKAHPFFGVGLGNFLIELPSFLKTPGNTFFIQPVHNIYLLILAETGIVGFSFFGWFIFKTLTNLKSQNSNVKPTSQNSKLKKNLLIPNSLFVILSEILIIGLFDHYFITLQQGQLLLTVIMSLCYNKYIYE